MKKKSTQQFIEEAYNKHCDKYNYSLVEYINAHTKIKIICPEHGIFEQAPNSHIKGYGCYKCKSTNKLSTDEFINKANLIHDNKYNYSLVEYINSLTKVKIFCHKHGVFEQRPSVHLFGQGCPYCYGKTKKSTQQFIEDAVSVHGDKYSYSLVEYENNSTKVKITCPEHGVFEQIPYNHIGNKNNCPKCINMSFSSQQEQELQEWLSQYIDIKINDRLLISPYELDIIIPSKKIAIEYDGLYWHSEQRGKDKNYHLNKYNLCKEQGYRLIHIFSDEWENKKDIVKSRLKHIIGMYDKSIYARKCTIKEIPHETAKHFIDRYHIQGYTSCSIKIGLFYSDELVAVMTFAKPSISKGRKTKTGLYELSRFCSSYKVTGGAGKLLKFFINNYDADHILTYADLRWSNGNLYNILGFDYHGHTPANYWYIINNNRKHRFNYRKNVLNRKLAIFDPNLTEYQNMLNNGYDRIWDCGNMKFEMMVEGNELQKT